MKIANLLKPFNKMTISLSKYYEFLKHDPNIQDPNLIIKYYKYLKIVLTSNGIYINHEDFLKHVEETYGITPNSTEENIKAIVAYYRDKTDNNTKAYMEWYRNNKRSMQSTIAKLRQEYTRLYTERNKLVSKIKNGTAGDKLSAYQDRVDQINSVVSTRVKDRVKETYRNQFIADLKQLLYTYLQLANNKRLTTRNFDPIFLNEDLLYNYLASIVFQSSTREDLPEEKKNKIIEFLTTYLNRYQQELDEDGILTINYRANNKPRYKKVDFNPIINYLNGDYLKKR